MKAPQKVKIKSLKLLANRCLRHLFTYTKLLKRELHLVTQGLTILRRRMRLEEVHATAPDRKANIAAFNEKALRMAEHTSQAFFVC